jgi:hypothetical protein
MKTTYSTILLGALLGAGLVQAQTAPELKPPAGKDKDWPKGGKPKDARN